MFFGDWLRMVWANLNRMRGRVALTAFGVVIGTAAVMVLVSLGAGLQRSATGSLGNIADLKRITVMGGNSEFVKAVSASGPAAAVSTQSQRGKATTLTNAVLDELRGLPGVSAVIPLEDIQGAIQMRYRKLYGGMSLVGVAPEALEQMGLTVDQGALSLARGQLLAGARLSESFWNPQKGESAKVDVLLGETLTLEGIKFGSEGEQTSHAWRYEVSGVLAEGGETDYQVFIPLREAQAINEWFAGKRIDRNKEGYPRAFVQVADSRDVQALQQQIRDLGLEAFSAMDTVQSINRFFSVLQAVLGSIGAIALLVAALGIVNTLSMAILERTREIGLMKALGAHNRDVMFIFLGEAGCIGLLGGVVGVLLGMGLSGAANIVIGSLLQQSNGGGIFGPSASSDIAFTPAWLPLFAIVFAVLIGLISGVYPALRAASLDPLRALKYE